METIVQDIRYGLRQLRKSPGFTAVAVITVALGIGANTTIFSIVNSFLLRPLPVPDANQITMLAAQRKNAPAFPVFSIADYRDLRSQTGDVFSGLFTYQFGMDGMTVNGKTDRILTNYVGGNFFSALGVKPAAGRFILPGEGETAGADPVMVLDYGYWKGHFAADPDIVGKTVSMNGRPVTIVGIAPESFHGLNALVATQAYLPQGMSVIEGEPADFMTNHLQKNVFIYGRLKPGISIEQARASLNVVAGRLAEQYPDSNKDLGFIVYPEVRSRPNPDPTNTILIISTLFLALASMVLLLACVNVANILLVRATVRAREMAIRAALGAARVRLIRQLLTESIVLALAGGITGMALGWWGSRALSSIHLQFDVPVRLDFSFDWRLFAYAFSIALLTGLIVGVVPAIRASREDLSTVLHEGGRGVVSGRHAFRDVLVIVQVAGSLMLLIIAGLFMRSLGKAQQTTLGFDPRHVLNLSMDPTEIGYSDPQGRQFYKNLLERVRAIPGIESASVANSVPMGYYGNFDLVKVNGYESAPGKPEYPVSYNTISAQYFDTMRIALLRGRAINEQDAENSQYVAVINEAMAQKYWPDQDPIGHEFKLGTDPQHPIQVIGVAKNSRFVSLTGTITPFFFVPFTQHYTGNSLATLQLRTATAPESVIPEIERLIDQLAPTMPVFDVKTMSEALDTINGMLLFEVGAVLAASLGILGLILAVIGVYGVVSYAASQKTREIGIRMALGAQPLQVLKMVFRQGFLIIGIGLALGIVAAFASARLMARFLVVQPSDPVTYISVGSILAFIALAACFIPARRAMRVDPVVALRYE